MNNISANIDNIFLDINQIIEEYSVNQNITLIAVSKKKSVEAIKIAYDRMSCHDKQMELNHA